MRYLFENNTEATEKDILSYYMTYLQNEETTTIEDAKDELYNDFLAALFTTPEGMEQYLQWLSEDKNTSVKEKKSILETLKAFIENIIDRLKEYVHPENFTKSEQQACNMQLEQAEKFRDEILQMVDETIENLENGVEINVDTKFSIKEISGKKGSYGIGVYLDSDIFNGIRPRNWSKVLNDYVYNHLAGAQIVVTDKSGNAETIEFARKNERIRKNGSENSRKVIDKLARKKGLSEQLAVAHAVELISVSEKENRYTNDNSHQWLDENGWEYRNVYLQNAVNKKIYSAELNIANTKDGRKILYDINKIKEVDDGVVASKGSHITSTSDNSIHNNETNVNTKFSAIENLDNGVEINADPNTKYSINPDFAKKYDEWDKKDPRVTFTLGTTSNVLIDLGLNHTNITIDSSKIIKIKSKHSEMTDLIIKQIPDILENPIMVMRSKSFESRLTMFGEVYAGNKPILAVLELLPKDRNNMALEEFKVASAYGKDNAQNFINSSSILYIDKNKNRVRQWEMRTGLQLPVGKSISNSNNSIPNSDENVNKFSRDVDGFRVDTKNSTDIDRNVARKKQTRYNEFNTLAMQWAHSNDTNVGDTTILNRKGKEFVLLEATEDGYIELCKGKYDYVREIYVQIHGKTNDSVYEYTRQIRSERNGSMRSGSTANRRSDDVRNSGLVGGKRLQDNTAGDNEHLRKRDKEVSEQVKFSRDADFSYQTLVRKPDMNITVIEDSVTTYNSQSRKDIVDNSINNAKKIGIVNENGNAVIYVNDINENITVPKSAIRHALDRRIGVNAPVVQNIGAILKNAIKINELSSRNVDNIEKSYVLIGIAKNALNEPYVVSFIANKYTNELTSMNVLYAVNAKKEPTGSSKSPQVLTPATGSVISISDLLDYVNKYFPDVLPEAVLKHYGYDSRPEGRLGESAMFSRDVDFSKALDDWEWRKFYSAVQTDNQNDNQRIGENGIIIPTEESRTYKLIYYNEDSDSNVTVHSVYQLENYDYNIHDEIDNPIKYLIEVEEGWLNEKRAKAILQNYQLLYGTVFRKYSRQSNSFIDFTRSSKKTLRSNTAQSDRAGISAGDSKDKRYSIDVDAYYKDDLLTQNAKLRKAVEYYKNLSLTTQTDFKRDDVRRLALAIKREYKSRINTESGELTVCGDADVPAADFVFIDSAKRLCYTEIKSYTEVCLYAKGY